MSESVERVRRRLDEVFGEVLPVTTGDERDERDERPAVHDEQLLADRPPHHDQA